MSLSKIFKKVVLHGAMFVAGVAIGGMFDFSLFHDLSEGKFLMETATPHIQSFYHATGISDLAQWGGELIAGQTMEEYYTTKAAGYGGTGFLAPKVA